jgi:asparagine synthetase B (glutamine-hydrolysing)
VNLKDQFNYELIQKRGPNYFSTFETSISSENKQFKALFCSSVLSLRGSNSEQLTKQPIIGTTINSDQHKSNILLWNGELFDSQNDLIKVHRHENDGWKIFQTLNSQTGTEIERNILKILASIKGPFAFVYFHRSLNKIYFGRDKFGRRSLLINKNNKPLEPIIALSSVKVEFNNDSTLESKLDFEEVDTNGFYRIDLNSLLDDLDLTLFKWDLNVNRDVKRSSSPLKVLNLLSLFNSVEPFNDNIDNIDENDQIDPNYLEDVIFIIPIIYY